MPNKPQWIGIIGSDKGMILDINKKKIVRTIPKWSGNISKDGKYTLYAPSRYVYLLEHKHKRVCYTFSMTYIYDFLEYNELYVNT